MNLRQAMRERYPSPEWALVFEVANATGGMARRRADALAMNLWPSRGLAMHGFEFKTDRRDWVRELKSPEKAEELARFCDAWWLVVDDEAIVKDGELPAGWGLLVGRKGKLVQKVDATLREREPTFPRSFVAAFVRAATDSAVPRADVEAEIEKRVAERVDRQAQHNQALEWQRKHDELYAEVLAFVEASGVRLTDRYEGMRRLGELVARAKRTEAVERDRENAVATTRRVIENLKRAIDAIESDDAKKTDAEVAS